MISRNHMNTSGMNKPQGSIILFKTLLWTSPQGSSKASVMSNLQCIVQTGRTFEVFYAQSVQIIILPIVAAVTALLLFSLSLSLSVNCTLFPTLHVAHITSQCLFHHIIFSAFFPSPPSLASPAKGVAAVCVCRPLFALIIGIGECDVWLPGSICRDFIKSMLKIRVMWGQTPNKIMHWRTDI